MAKTAPEADERTCKDPEHECGDRSAFAFATPRVRTRAAIPPVANASIPVIGCSFVSIAAILADRLQRCNVLPAVASVRWAYDVFREIAR